MSKHTSGPWRYDYETGYCGELVNANGSVIATFSDEPSKANASLIAAAPELLQACLYAIRAGDLHGLELKPVRAAIAKATGEHHDN